MTTTETEERIIRYNDAFNETLAELLRDDPDIFIAGEDVGRYGGVFQSFAGLNAEFGDQYNQAHPCKVRSLNLEVLQVCVCPQLDEGLEVHALLPH